MSAQRYIDSKVIRARLNANVERALDIMEQCMNDLKLNAKDRYKIASDYLGWFVKIENEIMKAEEHREAMKLRKLNSLIKTLEYEDLLEERREGEKDDSSTQSNFSPNVQQPS